MKTFGELKKEVLRLSGSSDHFQFIQTSQAYREFWKKMNKVEYELGYVHGEYEKPGTPALCEMELLSETEYLKWIEDLKAI